MCRRYNVIYNHLVFLFYHKMIESQYTDVLRKNRKFIEKYDHHDKILHYEGVKHVPLETQSTPDVY